MDIFSNREVAISVWLVVLLCFTLRKSEVRESFSHLFKAFIQVQVIAITTIMILYVFLITYLLVDFDIWDLGQLKNTCFWFLFAAYPNLMKMDDIRNDPNYFKNAVLDNVKFLAFFEFFINFYSFSIVGELVFVPISAIAGLLIAYTKGKEKYLAVERLVTKVIGVVGIFITGYAIFSLFNDPESFSSFSTLQDYVVPALLSILLLPFIFVLAAYTKYELIYIRLKFLSEQNAVVRYAVLRAFLSFRFEYQQLTDWSQLLAYHDLKDKKTVDKSIRDYFRQKQAEAHT